ncbi:MAG: phospho-N-acetylmuramoyl-pentapeptide-transferase [Coriobacteriales bacterium]|jgi:phospho-N-acetylmuramoyl-pentapeptide-transferase|nr:phospho-N-acetylmuramoyl-pentapeptide-transferase [Coriobacteriales bacterium]
MLGNTILAQYPTFLTFLAVFVAMVVVMVLMPFFIRLLRVHQIGQQVRADGPERHLVKQGTPTMGGVVILVSVAVGVVLCGVYKPKADFVPLILVTLATIATGVIGFVDDASKVIKERSLGLRPNAKMILLTLISVAFCLAAVNWGQIRPTVTIPFLPPIDLGVLSTTIDIAGFPFQIPWLYLIFVFLLMAGFSNAVNLVDGLDGLAAGTVLVTMAVMAAIAYRSNMIDLALFAASVCGGCIGFLWFNAYPAKIFMGDTGSLALGAAFAGIAVMTKTEAVSILVGAIFVIEALSVIIQVGYFKLTRKRVFLMAPLHHHFEQKGWSETTVVIRFWIVAALFASLGFAIFFYSGIH